MVSSPSPPRFMGAIQVAPHFAFQLRANMKRDMKSVYSHDQGLLCGAQNNHSLSSWLYTQMFWSQIVLNFSCEIIF